MLGSEVHRDIDIGPTVVIEVVRSGGDGRARAGLQYAGLFRDVGKGSISVVVIEKVGLARQAARAAHGGHALPLAEGHIVQRRRLVRIEFDEIANEKV